MSASYKQIPSVLPAAALLALCCASAACAASGDDDASAPSGNGQGGSHSGPANPGSSGGSGGVGGTSTPPEREPETRYLAPVVSGKYLWSANPLSGRVAIIDAENFEVKLDTAGDGPTQVLGLPEREGVAAALILNQRSDDATLIRVLPDGSLEKLPAFRTQAAANAWVKSASAEFAIAYTLLKDEAAVSALETFQEITLFMLRPGAEAAHTLTVGPRPSRFVFDAREQHAYAVTQAGISVIELGREPAVTGLIELSSDAWADPADLDVSFSPDGSRAVVRREGASRISVLSLPEGDRQEYELGAQVTDLDLSADGKIAYAVLGPSHAVVSLPLDDAASAGAFPRVELPEESFGAIALNADGSGAVVYSTVLDSRRATVFDVSPAGELSGPRSFDLVSRVSALFAAPDPRFAVTLQLSESGASRRGAFSLLSFQADRVPKIVATQAPPLEVSFEPQGTAALLSVGDSGQGVYGMYLIHLDRQRVDRLDLASPPLAVGIVPAAQRGYVAQAHPEGRITFVALDGSDIRTLTGFELAARIRE